MRATSQGLAGQVADELRGKILRGELQPGQRLSEERVREQLSTSRSTLREAFQLLVRERLLVHRLARGVFVRELCREDVVDLYRARRTVQCAALAAVASPDPTAVERVQRAVREGRDAATHGDWDRVAAASVRFHLELSALSGSARLTALVAELLTEFRLAYARMDDRRAFHLDFLDRNAEIAQAVAKGQLEEAVDLLRRYLDDSEAMVLLRYDD